MNTIKKLNGIFYFLIFILFLIQLLHDIFNIRVFNLSNTFIWTPLLLLFFLFFFLSIVSLFKKDIIFYGVPYLFYVAYIIMMIINFLLNMREDLQ
jgi:hypothetical protein